MADPDLISYAQHIGAAFKLGSGLLGKSAIALGLFLVVAIVAVFRLHSDWAIIATLVFAAIVFFIWFFPVIRFAEKHPDAALLEGAEWSGFQRFQAAAKGYIPSLPDKEPSLLPGSQPALPPEDIGK
jgi:hypothetical protein